jgi:transposase-like protein
MPRKYDNNFKSMIINLIVNEKHSTIKTAEQFDIPLKTLEKWITAYNKDNRVFDADYKSQAQIINDLKRKISSLEKDNEILKKTITLLAKKE